MQLILASKSQRRIDLLAGLGLKFQVQAADLDETPHADEDPKAYVLRLAKAKAQAIAATRSDACVVLGADTIVAQKNRLLGKPRDADDARLMLSELAGKTHHVLTGFAFVVLPAGTVIAGVASTEVSFRSLTPNEIDNYVATGEPLDKAGAYAIQGGAAGFVAKRVGSLSNVIGLPLEDIVPHLADLLKIPSLLEKKADII
jgi:septum formation protein